MARHRWMMCSWIPDSDNVWPMNWVQPSKAMKQGISLVRDVPDKVFTSVWSHQSPTVTSGQHATTRTAVDGGAASSTWTSTLHNDNNTTTIKNRYKNDTTRNGQTDSIDGIGQR